MKKATWRIHLYFEEKSMMLFCTLFNIKLYLLIFTFKKYLRIFHFYMLHAMSNNFRVYRQTLRCMGNKWIYDDNKIIDAIWLDACVNSWNFCTFICSTKCSAISVFIVKLYNAWETKNFMTIIKQSISHGWMPMCIFKNCLQRQ